MLAPGRTGQDRAGQGCQPTCQPASQPERDSATDRQARKVAKNVSRRQEKQEKQEKQNEKQAGAEAIVTFIDIKSCTDINSVLTTEQKEKKDYITIYGLLWS